MKRIFSFFFMMAVITIFSAECSGMCSVGSKIKGKLYSRDNDGYINYIYYNGDHFYSGFAQKGKPVDDLIFTPDGSTHPNIKQHNVLPHLSALASVYSTKAFTLSILGIKQALAADTFLKVNSDTFASFEVTIDSYDDPITKKYTKTTRPKTRYKITTPMFSDTIKVLEIPYDSEYSYTATPQEYKLSKGL